MIDALKAWPLGAANEIEGRTTGAETSVIVVDMPPGPGPALHRHPYAETFILLEGRARQPAAARPPAELRPPARFAVPGWSDESTRQWLDQASCCVGGG
ncbi:hypothetical protein CI1B_56930 [Bradyrhizobium ivorense]|uniref:Cupin 2 conserved barrel domain-containing protein n=1 Tax=Bradyrhizobium ivorense TaxID=2511166 RepID=A0A508TKU0_9BRAD|nr:hypothetical protein [Bradyrhizobium ivorense]VIO74974.1 hypothetical protein CI1B_56930 [Bradyrhizobium ivorense]